MTLTGTNFTAGAEVLIGSTPVPAGSVTRVSDTEIRVVMPASSPAGPQTVLVQARTSGGTSASQSYAYTNSAPVAGDVGFSGQQGFSVASGAPGMLAQSSDADGDVLIAYINTAPVHGTMVLNADGSFTYTPTADFYGVDGLEFNVRENSFVSIASVAEATFRIEPTQPVVSALSSTTGSLTGGTPITITGSNFLGASGVSIGGVALAPADFTVNDATTITATTPPGVTPGPAEVRVHKVNNNVSPPMNVSGALAGAFTYLAPGALSVSDGNGLVATGPVGGPFAPPSKVWTLENTGQEDIEVTVTVAGSFIELAGATPGTAFTLTSGETLAVTASFNVSADTLPVGPAPGTITFTNTTNDDGSTSRTVQLDVQQIASSVGLTSSGNVTSDGEEVILTAAVMPASATGEVEFRSSVDGLLGTALLSGGEAAFPFSALSVGTHQITAHYLGDVTHAAEMSSALAHTVQVLGAVIVRQVNGGSRDATFGFSSPTPSLNLSVSTSGGVGESAPVPLPAGSYTLTAVDMRPEGFVLEAISCSDADSVGDVDLRSASITLDPGETVTCTFAAASSREDALDAIASFMQARAGILLANQPDIQRRFDRLNGVVGSGGNPVSSLMAYLPGLVEGGTLSMAASLAQIERLAGVEQPSRFDAWASLTHGRYSANGAEGDFTLAAIGADWLVNRDLLIGGFAQFDRLTQNHNATGASVDGTGWMVGPYLTARLSEHLFLDVLAAGGRSSNSVSPYGTYDDDFAATRYMLSAALQGQWKHGAWTFLPRARLSWFRERSDAYVDSLGVAIPSVNVEQGQFAFGPGVSYRFDLDGDLVVDTGLRFEGVADFVRNSHLGDEDSFHGRVEGSLGFAFLSGARLSLSASHDGIGRSGTRSTAGRISVSVPLN